MRRCRPQAARRSAGKLCLDLLRHRGGRPRGVGGPCGGAPAPGSADEPPRSEIARERRRPAWRSPSRPPARGVTALFVASAPARSAPSPPSPAPCVPTPGGSRLDDRVLFDRRRRDDMPMERRQIGWVFQDARLFPHLDVRGNLDYGGPPRRPPGRRAVRRGGRGPGRRPLWARRPRELSGGERQRGGDRARCSASRRCCYMDEPLAALDAPRKAEILPFLERVKTRLELPILYVAHALSEVVRWPTAWSDRRRQGGGRGAAGRADDAAGPARLRPRRCASPGAGGGRRHDRPRA